MLAETIQFWTQMWHATLYSTQSCAVVISINSLWPSDAIWRQRSRSTLAQVMACWLTAPSHYLNQCWLIITKVLWHSFATVSQQLPKPSISEISFEIGYLKFYSDPPGANELKHGDDLTYCLCYLNLFDMHMVLFVTPRSKCYFESINWKYCWN